MRKPILTFATLAIAATAPGRAQTGTPRIALVEELRIDGAVEDLSGGSRDVWVGSDGRMAFMNEPDVRFVFFDGAGKRLGTFGGPGEGPGEFPPEGTLRSGTLGDTMSVYSSRQRRFTLIAPDLKLVRTMRLPPRDSSILMFDPMALLPGNRILGSAMFGREADSQSQLLDRTQDTLLVMTATGAIERKLGGRPHDFTNARVRRPSGTGTISVRTPFVQRPQLFVTRSGDRYGTLTSTITSATGGTIHVRVVRATGEQAFSRTYPFTSGAIPKQVIDSEFTRLTRPYGTPEYAEIRRILRAKIPAVYPPVRSVVLATDGSVWIERELVAPGPREVLVLSPTGEIRGAAVFPRAGLELRHATQTHVWAVESDADGFVSIVRFRVGT